MGNRVSLAQEEREEAEYEDLVQAVERARRYAPFDGDVEAGIRRHRARVIQAEGKRLGDYDPFSGTYRNTTYTQQPAAQAEGPSVFGDVQKLSLAGEGRGGSRSPSLHYEEDASSILPTTRPAPAAVIPFVSHSEPSRQPHGPVVVVHQPQPRPVARTPPAIILRSRRSRSRSPTEFSAADESIHRREPSPSRSRSPTRIIRCRSPSGSPQRRSSRERDTHSTPSPPVPPPPATDVVRSAWRTAVLPRRRPSAWRTTVIQSLRQLAEPRSTVVYANSPSPHSESLAAAVPASSPRSRSNSIKMSSASRRSSNLIERSRSSSHERSRNSSVSRGRSPPRESILCSLTPQITRAEETIAMSTDSGALRDPVYVRLEESREVSRSRSGSLPVIRLRRSRSRHRSMSPPSCGESYIRSRSSSMSHRPPVVTTPQADQVPPPAELAAPDTVAAESLIQPQVVAIQQPHTSETASRDGGGWGGGGGDWDGNDWGPSPSHPTRNGLPRVRKHPRARAGSPSHSPARPPQYARSRRRWTQGGTEIGLFGPRSPLESSVGDLPAELDLAMEEEASIATGSRSRSRSPPTTTPRRRNDLTSWDTWQAMTPLSRSRSPRVVRADALSESLNTVTRDLSSALQRMQQFHSEQSEKMREREEKLISFLQVMERKIIRTRVASPARSYTPSILLTKRADDPQDYDEKKDDSRVEGYPSLPFAAGLRLMRKDASMCVTEWKPTWTLFPLKAFRGSSYTYMKIQPHWDDEALLTELNRTYDRLRTVWRKWFSLRGVSSITMVLADHSFVYPQRIGPAKVHPSKNMRLRYLLKHPKAMKGRHEFMQVLTDRTDVGIEFVERFQLSRIAIAVMIPVLGSMIVGIVYSALTGDVSSAFTVAGYLTSAYSVCLVLIGVLNLVEF